MTNQELRIKETFLEIIDAVIEKKYVKSWVGCAKPSNFVTLQEYKGWNKFYLSFVINYKNFLPFFGTYKQFESKGVKINKGQKGINLGYWNFYYLDKEGIKYTEEEIKVLMLKLTSEQIKELKLQKKAFWNSFVVFSISQTNFHEIYPDSKLLKEEIVEKTKVLEIDFLNKLLKDWVCPINIVHSDQAFYVPMLDKIVLPLKSQFFDDEEFYCVALHEMAHSTGHKCRLDRFSKVSQRSSNNYAEEEVIAEFSATIIAMNYNLKRKPSDNNIHYIKHYFKEEFNLSNLMTKVNQVVKFFDAYIEEKQLITEQKKQFKE